MLRSVLGTKKEAPGLARIPKTEKDMNYKEDVTKSNSSPRQSEIEKLNNTVQFSSPNGSSNKYKTDLLSFYRIPS